MTKLKRYSWCLYFLTPLLALGLGWAQWDWGKLAFAPWSLFKLGLIFLGFLFFIHTLLVLPLVKWVWEAEGLTFSRFKLISLSSVLLSLPLVSFSYWWGDVRTILQAQEVTLSIIPAVVLSTLIYDRRKKLWTWSLSLTAMIFFHLVFVSEILGPFRTYIYLLSHDNRFEYLRAIVPAIAIALYYRLEFEPGNNSWSGINAIHHAWKSSRFSQMLKTTNPGKGSLKSESKT